MHLFSILKLYEFLITVGVRNSFCGVLHAAVHCIDHCAIQVFLQYFSNQKCLVNITLMLNI